MFLFVPFWILHHRKGVLASGLLFIVEHCGIWLLLQDHLAKAMPAFCDNMPPLSRGMPDLEIHFAFHAQAATGGFLSTGRQLALTALRLLCTLVAQQASGQLE